MHNARAERAKSKNAVFVGVSLLLHLLNLFITYLSGFSNTSSKHLSLSARPGCHPHPPQPDGADKFKKCRASHGKLTGARFVFFSA